MPIRTFGIITNRKDKREIGKVFAISYGVYCAFMDRIPFMKWFNKVERITVSREGTVLRYRVHLYGRYDYGKGFDYYVYLDTNGSIEGSFKLKIGRESKTYYTYIHLGEYDKMLLHRLDGLLAWRVRSGKCVDTLFDRGRLYAVK